ncbi:MAG TPA: response regulator transcription factor, partial [Armatimonadota bacterium]|nr:response regulator transcription factor [Armatimonadota bacterium]
GADDCLALPLSDSEIIVRIRIMLQNYQRQSQAKRKYPHIEILTEERRVIINGTSLHLTVIEFDLLAVLTNRPGIVVSRQSLAQLVWGDDWVGDERLVDSHMCRLRKKIQAAGLHTSLLLCVRGVGYVFRPDEETPATV